MKFYLTLSTAFMIGSLEVAQGGPISGAAHVDKATMDKALAGGLNVVVDDSSEWGLRVLGMRRVKSGNVESHASESTVFYIIDGEADVVMGGTIVNMKEDQARREDRNRPDGRPDGAPRQGRVAGGARRRSVLVQERAERHYLFRREGSQSPYVLIPETT